MSEIVVGSMPAAETSSTTLGEPYNAMAVKAVAPDNIRVSRVKTKVAGDGQAVDVTGVVWDNVGRLASQTDPFTVAADEGVEDPITVEYDVPLLTPVDVASGRVLYLGLWVPGEGERVNLYFSDNYVGTLEYLVPKTQLWDTAELGDVDFETATEDYFLPVLGIGMVVEPSVPFTPGAPVARDGRPWYIPELRGAGMCTRCGRRPRNYFAKAGVYGPLCAGWHCSLINWLADRR